MASMTKHDGFATPRYPISTTSLRWQAISCATLRKPRLLTILRNVCNAEFARRRKQETPTDFSEHEAPAEELPIWQEPTSSPETTMVRRQDDDTIRRLVAALPQPFREAIVLREINDLSYHEIAEVAGVPVG